MGKLDTSKPEELMDFVKNQDRTNKEFNRISDIWLKQCIPYDEFEQILEKSAECTHDATIKLSQIVPELNGEEIAIKILGGKYDGSIWNFSKWSKGQFCKMLNLTPGLLNSPENGVEQECINNFIVERMKNVVGDSDKEMFVRLRENGNNTVRAFLTKQYRVIDHRWTFKQVRKNIPDGLVSHFDKGSFLAEGGDYLTYNALIPESIREEKDSGYGAMFTTINGEIGNSYYKFYPSIFRAICMNGCIWYQQQADEFRQMHKGEVNLNLLAMQMKALLHDAIPLVPQMISTYRSLQTMETKTPTIKMLAFLGNDRDLLLNQGQTRRLMFASMEERFNPSAFSFINAVTRGVQDREYFTPEQQNNMECFVGNRMEEWVKTPKKFESFATAANDLAIDKLHKYVGALSL